MLRPFFYNARTWGPTQARDIIFLVKPDHLALEAELTLGPLARCILAIFWFTSTQMCITDFRRSTGKLYEMCLRTPSTLFMPGPGEQLSTYGVV